MDRESRATKEEQRPGVSLGEVRALRRHTWT